MPDSGKDLGVDRYRLWQAGSKDWPMVASHYTKAGHSLDEALHGLAQAFLRSPRLGGPYGPAYEPWRALRDEMRKILTQTASNLELTGDALCIAAENYERSDTAAEAEFNRLRNGG
ncbi:hypothetical protein GCM10027605_16050 [Micromonospora zhanjiangensis]